MILVCPSISMQSISWDWFSSECRIDFVMSNTVCNDCGTQLPVGARFCSQCGSKNIRAGDGASGAVKIQSAFDDQKLQQLQENEASPLFALSTFEELGLQEELLKGIRMMGWKKPSKIQCVTLPHVLQYVVRCILREYYCTGCAHGHFCEPL